MGIILHALNCSIAGHKQVLIKSVDSDSVVLVVPFFLSLHIDELWVAYGVKNIIGIFQYIYAVLKQLMNSVKHSPFPCIYML
jgi:hypothetical protein